MNLTHRTVVAGLAALSLGISASPALAKGINNTVTSISPSVAPAPTTGGGGGGGGRPATCRAIGVDPMTGSTIVTCTQSRP
jgi:hypothetical protein